MSNINKDPYCQPTKYDQSKANSTLTETITSQTCQLQR